MAEDEDTPDESGEEPTKVAADSGSKRTRRKRGTSFPVVALPEAARILKEAGKYGFEHPAPAFASYMGHSTTNSGAFRQRLAAFRDWGLIIGRGDTLAMTDIARMIALPTDSDAERRAMQEAFNNCEVFSRLYDQSAKGLALDSDRLAGRAVHELGVTPSNSSKFIESFVESALAAELAELDDGGEVVLWSPENGGAEPETSEVAVEPVLPTGAPQAHIRPSSHSVAAPTISQLWPISGGQILFELRSESALPASAFAAIGEVVAKLEALAGTLAAEGHADLSDDVIER